MTQEMPWDLSQEIVRNDRDVMATPIDTDLVLMSIDRGRYYGTSIVGNRIWNLLEEAITGFAICQKLSQEFQVQTEICESEVSTFLFKLHEEGLLEILR